MFYYVNIADLLYYSYTFSNTQKCYFKGLQAPKSSKYKKIDKQADKLQTLPKKLKTIQYMLFNVQDISSKARRSLDITQFFIHNMLETGQDIFPSKLLALYLFEDRMYRASDQLESCSLQPISNRWLFIKMNVVCCWPGHSCLRKRQQRQHEEWKVWRNSKEKKPSDKGEETLESAMRVSSILNLHTSTALHSSQMVLSSYLLRYSLWGHWHHAHTLFSSRRYSNAILLSNENVIARSPTKRVYYMQ